jgi:protein phosphatase
MTSEFLIESAVLTHPGRKRPQNEDFAAFFEPERPDELRRSGRLYLVADGVGGAAKGERASQYAVEKVLYEYYRDPDPDVGARLKRAMRQAGNDIFDHVERSGQPTRMATTMVAAAVREGRLTVANVGDSRAYLIRGGSAAQLTRDHTVAGELLRDGEIDEVEALNVKGRHRLMRSLGGERDVTVDVFPDIPLEAGDRILLCTDGLARYALADDIAALGKEGSPEEIARRSVDYANKHGGVDNIGVAVVQIGEIPPHAAPTLRRRGRIPQPVDWDAMVTVPSARTRVSRRRRRSRGERLALAFLGVSIAAAIIVGGFLVARQLIGSAGAPSPLPPVAATSTPVTESTYDAGASGNPTVTADGAPGPTPSDTAVATPGLPLELPQSPPDVSRVMSENAGVWSSPDIDAPLVVHWLDGDAVELDATQRIGPYQNPFWIYFEGEYSNDCHIHVTARPSTCSPGDTYGLVVRFDPSTQQDAIGVEFRCDGQVRVVAYSGPRGSDQFDPLTEGQVGGPGIGGGGEGHQIDLRIQGTDLVVWVDGAPIVNVMDQRLGRSIGTFGMFVAARESDTFSAVFRDLQVWYLGQTANEPTEPGGNP